MSVKPPVCSTLQLSPATGKLLRLASTQVPAAPTLLATPGWEVASRRSAPPIQTRPLPAKWTKLTSPSGTLKVHWFALPSPRLETGMPAAGTAVHESPLSIERSTWPPSPTARPIAPPAWNSTSLSGDRARGPHHVEAA